MRNLVALGLGLFVVCAISGCDDANNAQNLILGKWNVKQQVGSQQISGTTEFRKNGGMTTIALGKRLESTYKFIDGHTIEVERNFGGKAFTEKNKIENISKDNMVLVDPQGGKAIFTRTR